MKCDVTGLEFSSISVNRCHHPAVVASYGKGNKCNVSVWVCKKCQHAARPDPAIDGYKCIYKGEK
jgi:hypothetical protein